MAWKNMIKFAMYLSTFSFFFHILQSILFGLQMPKLIHREQIEKNNKGKLSHAKCATTTRVQKNSENTKNFKHIDDKSSTFILPYMH